ncbi:hypothetical protein [Streptosporangium sp. NBC_01469]|uniref:hypothetical protein n=1 Tax=Streptosporangium sp. NBC_01469 TaxID=2903898 RepID=UPI002E2BB25A|nr:hypothetical protein [Streptosporangium sp. NBC_01469]
MQVDGAAGGVRSTRRRPGARSPQRNCHTRPHCCTAYDTCGERVAFAPARSHNSAHNSSA